MKRLILALALGLTACGGDARPVAPGSVAATVDRVVLNGARGFAVAELWYTTGAEIAAKQVDRGRITGATATKVRAWNAEARHLLVTGKATADKAEKAAAAARLFDIGDLLRNPGAN